MYWKSNEKLEEYEKKLIEILQTIDDTYGDFIIIVEGKRDEQLLRDFGVEAPIIRTQAGKSRFQLVEEIVRKADKGGKVLILTDFDSEGIEIAKSLSRALERYDVRVMRRLRLVIRKYMGPYRAIEELVALFKKRDFPK
ncbi:MAG: hypothetical protein KGY80_02560 [Candidatus Thorarchaeota archaeon]|nr:hypothetical protein [Candidatus Thorarchaeota archaeon]